MELRHGLDLRMEQRLKLAPQIIQSIEILQLPVMELQERIEQELEQNPVLEIDEPEMESSATPGEGEGEGDGEGEGAAEEEFSDELEQLLKLEDEWREYLSRSTSSAAAQEETDRKSEALENTADRPPTLHSHLLEQLAFYTAPEPVTEAARMIILDLDDNGYLRHPLEELFSGYEQVSEEDAAAALKLVQGLEPRGVGARDLQECLTLQLDLDDNRNELAARLLAEHLGDIEKNKLPWIAKKTGESMDAVKDAVEKITHLNPRPGALVGGITAPHVIPDVEVHYEDGQYRVDVEESTLPTLRISSTYRRMLEEEGGNEEVRKYIQKKIESAKWMMDAIEQRKSTLRKVSQAIVDFQKEFMDKGPGNLRPLKMQRVADAVGVHVSTVSRAIADKYIDTPQGVYPLRYFFSGGTISTDGQVSSWKTVKDKIGELIEKEDKRKPFSDEELAGKMQEEGYDMARRTVTKYRKALGIRSSRQRKQY